MIHSSFLLNNAARIPVIGFRTSTIEDPIQLKLAMEAGLKSGCRHFDTNNLNRNERIVGKVIERWISRGLLKREELFITVTLPMAGVHPERVETFMDKSLKNLGLDYVDLYLIQFPVTVKYNEIIDLPVNEIGEIQTETTDLIEVWQKMEDMSDYGRARAIGVSNFNRDQILRILEKARIEPAVLQIEIHPYFQNQHLVDFCGQKGITVVAYSPFGSSRTNPFNKEEESLTYQKNISGLALASEVLVFFTMKKPLKNSCKKKTFNVLEDKTVISISEKHSKTPAQIVLRFLVHMGVAIIWKSSNASRISENMDIFNFSLDKSDIVKLKNLDRGDNARTNNMALKGLLEHPEYPFK